jgi:hypothetical protein
MTAVYTDRSCAIALYVGDTPTPSFARSLRPSVIRSVELFVARRVLLRGNGSAFQCRQSNNAAMILVDKHAVTCTAGRDCLSSCASDQL